MDTRTTRRAFALSGLSLASVPLARTLSATPPAAKPVASSFVMVVEGIPHRVTFLPSGLEFDWEGKPVTRYEGLCLEDDATAGAPGKFVVEPISDEEAPDPEPAGPDHPRPLEVRPDDDDEFPAIVRVWTDDDASRCRLCSCRCGVYQAPGRDGLAQCKVYLPAELADASIEGLALFAARSPLYHLDIDHSENVPRIDYYQPRFNGRP